MRRARGAGSRRRGCQLPRPRPAGCNDNRVLGARRAGRTRSWRRGGAGYDAVADLPGIAETRGTPLQARVQGQWPRAVHVQEYPLTLPEPIPGYLPGPPPSAMPCMRRTLSCFSLVYRTRWAGLFSSYCTLASTTCVCARTCVLSYCSSCLWYI